MVTQCMERRGGAGPDFKMTDLLGGGHCGSGEAGIGPLWEDNGTMRVGPGRLVWSYNNGRTNVLTAPF